MPIPNPSSQHRFRIKNYTHILEQTDKTIHFTVPGVCVAQSLLVQEAQTKILWTFRLLGIKQEL